MRTLRLSLAGTVILVLLGGLSFAAVAQSEEASGRMSRTSWNFGEDLRDG